MRQSSGVRKIHIAVDLDDVTLDFMQSVIDAFHLEYGIYMPYDDNPWGDNAKAIAKHPALLDSGYKSWWDWLRDRSWLWAQFPPVPGAIGGIRRLRAAGHYVECVTSKPEWAESNVWEWLAKWRPAFHRVTIVTNGQNKADFTDADLIIDDKRENCQAFMDSGRMAVQFDRGRSILLDTFPTAWSWDFILEYVREITDGCQYKLEI